MWLNGRAHNSQMKKPMEKERAPQPRGAGRHAAALKSPWQRTESVENSYSLMFLWFIYLHNQVNMHQQTLFHSIYKPSKTSDHHPCVHHAHKKIGVTWEWA
jgi:hypothetical protein